MKIVICGNYGVLNVGDEAILLGLKSAIGSIKPDAEIKVMGKGRLLPFGLRSFIKSIFNQKLWAPLKTIKTCDLFILGGGGLFTDEESSSGTILWTLHGIVALFYKKKVLVLGVSVGKLNFFNKILVKYLLKRADNVTVRDRESFEILNRMKIRSILSTDIAFLIKHCPVNSATTQKYVIISLRNFKSFNDSLYKFFAHACDKIIDKYGFHIQLMPFSDGVQNDHTVLNKLFTLMRNKEQIILHSYTQDFEKIFNIFHNASAVIAMRLHAGIFAAIAGVPFIAINYMTKVKNLWRQFPFINVVDFNEKEIMKIPDLIGSTALNSEKNKQLHKSLIELASKNIDVLKEFI